MPGTARITSKRGLCGKAITLIWTITLYQFVEPLLDDLGIDLRPHPHFIAKREWEPNKERILK